MKTTLLSLLILFGFCQTTWAQKSLNVYDFQAERSIDFLLQNLNHPEVTPGAVIASPSKDSPNYFYHWVRDAALTMNVLVRVYETSQSLRSKEIALRKLASWIQFEKTLQKVPNRSGGLGEPRFFVNGTANNSDWGRPQNDGPAIRAITMIRLAKALLKNGAQEYVQSLYCNNATCPIRLDLDYTATHWAEPSYDLWEEVKGQHFFTLIAQYRALTEGAELANLLGDQIQARAYQQQAQLISSELQSHKNSQKQLIEPTLNQVDGWNNKKSSLDVAVVLGILHFSKTGDEFQISQDDFLSSVQKLQDSFSFYPINQVSSPLAPAIGRYPEDVYDGAGFSGGNPWFIATNAYAELHCRLAAQINSEHGVYITPKNQHFYLKLLGPTIQIMAGENITSQDLRFQIILRKLQQTALTHLDRAIYHSGRNGQMYEQFSRQNGYMTGATDLTWSYSSYLTAYQACFGKLPSIPDLLFPF